MLAEKPPGASLSALWVEPTLLPEDLDAPASDCSPAPGVHLAPFGLAQHSTPAAVTLGVSLLSPSPWLFPTEASSDSRPGSPEDPSAFGSRQGCGCQLPQMNGEEGCGLTSFINVLVHLLHWYFFLADTCEALLGVNQGPPVFSGFRTFPTSHPHGGRIHRSLLPIPTPPPFCATDDPPGSLAADDLVSDSMGVWFCVHLSSGIWVHTSSKVLSTCLPAPSKTR